MKFFKGIYVILFGLLCFCLAALPLSAEEPELDLSRKLSVEEMNRIVDGYIADHQSISLERLSEMIMFVCDTNGINDVIRRIYEYGREVNSQKDMMCGTALLGISHMGTSNVDSSLFYLNGSIQLKEQLEEQGDMTPYMVVAVAYNSLGVVYIQTKSDYYKAGEYFLKALDIVDKGKFEYLETMVLSNVVMSHYYRSDPSGLQYAQRCRETVDKDSKSSFIGDYCMALMTLLNGRYEEAISYANRVIQNIDMEYGGGTMNVNTMIMSYNVMARSLMGLGRYKEADQTFKKAIALSEELEYEDIPDVYLGYGEYYEHKKDYHKALEVFNTGLEVSRKYDNKAYLDKLYHCVSRTYEELGDKDNAIRYLKMHQALKDTVYRASREMAINEMRAKYEVERYLKLFKDSKAEQARQNSMLILTGILLIISLLIIALIWHLLRKQNRSYVNLVKHYQENLTLRSHLAETDSSEAVTAETVTKEEPVPEMLGEASEEEKSAADSSVEKYRNSSLSDDKKNSIYREMCRMMEEDRIYRDSELNVDKMAMMLGTNRTYLSRIINEFEGINFNRYINKYRIKKAADIMSDKNNDEPIKYICLRVGFRSHATFSKIFSDEVGVTPQNYRKIAIEMSNNLNDNELSSENENGES